MNNQVIDLFAPFKKSILFLFIICLLFSSRAFSAPTIHLIPEEIVINENNSAKELIVMTSSIIESKQMTISCISSNDELLDESGIFINNIQTNEAVVKVENSIASVLIQLTPKYNKSGTADLYVNITDSDKKSISKKIELIVNSQPEIIIDNNNITVLEDEQININFSVIDESAHEKLEFTITSLNDDLIPSNNIKMSNENNNYTLNIKPSDNSSGYANIEIVVSDIYGLTAIETCSITIISVNDLPVISNVSDQYINENELNKNVHLSITDIDTSFELLQITVDSSNLDLIPLSNISINSNTDIIIDITPKLNSSGMSSITIAAKDIDNSYVYEYFKVYVNKIPEISEINDILINENSHNNKINLSIYDKETSLRDLIIDVESSNNSLIPENNENILLQCTSKSCSLYITPMANESGSLYLTVTVNDGKAESNRSFLVKINAFPEIEDIKDKHILEDKADEIIFTVNDDNDLNNLIIEAFSLDQEIVSDKNLTISKDNQGFILNIIPEKDKNGFLQISIKAIDERGLISIKNFNLYVHPVNDAPEITNIDNLIVNENAVSNPVFFTITDQETKFDKLTLSIVSSYTEVISQENIDITIADNGSSYIMKIEPEKGESGSVTITIIVSDKELESYESFNVLVNKSPDIASIEDKEIYEDNELAFSTIISDDENIADLNFSFQSSNMTLIPLENISYTINENTINITIKPSLNLSGYCEISLIVRDSNNLSDSKKFILHVIPQNDTPFLADIPDQSIVENQHANINIDIFDVDSLENELNIDFASSDLSLVPLENIQIINQTAGKILIITPTKNMSGTVKITLTVDDSNTFVSKSFILKVIPENESPVAYNASLEITEDNQLSYTLYAIDSDSFPQPLLYTILDMGLEKGHVELINSSTGKFIYYPDLNENGFDKFYFKVSDSLAESNTATITIYIKPENDKPSAYDSNITVYEGLDKSGFLNASDPDHDMLEYIIESDPEKGNVTILDKNTGSYIYVPNEDQTGSDSFDFKVLDSENIASYATVYITITPKQETEFDIKVNLEGDYQAGDLYEYSIIEYESGEEIFSRSYTSNVFDKRLNIGRYRLVIIGKGYDPFEYFESDLSNSYKDRKAYIDLIDDIEINVSLKANPDFNPGRPFISGSHTFLDKDNDLFDDGFVLNVRVNNFKNYFKILFKNEVIYQSTRSDPFIYTWIMGNDPYTELIENEPSNFDNTYIITLSFEDSNGLIGEYSVRFVDYRSYVNKFVDKPDEMVLFENAQVSGGAYNDQTKYITHFSRDFYPLIGTNIDFTIKDSKGNDCPVKISIPKIPLEYLYIDEYLDYTSTKDRYIDIDLQESDDIHPGPSEILTADIYYYTYTEAIANALTIDLKIANGNNKEKIVRYNPFHNLDKTGRDSYAPAITFPILLNNNYNNFENFSRALFDLMELFPILIVEKGDGSTKKSMEALRQINLPFSMDKDNDLLVNVQTNHLCGFAVNWKINEDNSSEYQIDQDMMITDSIDHSGCFIETSIFKSW